jgi:class 3 adenylate cyclase
VNPGLAAEVRSEFAMALWVGGRTEQAASAAREAAAVALELGSAAAAVRANVALGVSLLTLLDFVGSRAALEEGLAVARASKDDDLVLSVLIRLPLVTGLTGDLAAFEATASEALELARRTDANQEAEFALASMCNLAGGRGDFITVEQTGAEVRSIARLTGSPWAEPFVLAALAATRAIRGDTEHAEEAASALLPDDPGIAALVADAPAHRVLTGYLAVLAGRPAGAEQVTEQVVRDLIEQPAVLGNGAHLAAVVEIARALDAPALAELVREPLADLVQRGQLLSAGMPFLLTRSLALIDLLNGRWDGAERGLDEALAFARASGLHVEAARAMLDRADLLARRGERVASTDLRAEAAAIVESLELWGLAARAGVRPPIVVEPVHRSLISTRPIEQTVSVILFADISSSTAMTEELGDIAFRHRARRAEAVMRAAVGFGGGTAIEGIRLGDGILAEFSTEQGAVTAGLAMIDDMAPVGLGVHVGIHSGPVIRDAQSIFGGAVNMAARICDAAGAGELVVSGAVAEQLAAHDLAAHDLAVHDLGRVPLKGFDEPVALHRVTRSR